MTRLLLILLVILTFFGWKKYRYTLFSDNKLPATLTFAADQVDPCLDKKMCAVVYIAPWCPACHSVLPQLKTFTQNASKHDEYGILIVIGAGTFEQNQNTFKSFTTNAMIDSDSKIANSLGVNYFPTFLVLDAQREIKKRDHDAFTWMHQTFN